MMRVISMVPSLTETLLETADTFQVVGRTRYCIHPQEKTSTLPVVGGTKDIDWQAIQKLKPDLMIFDKEENPLKFAEECQFPWVAVHVESIQSMPSELNILAERLSSPGIKNLAARWEHVAQAPSQSLNFTSIPGELERWVLEPDASAFAQLVYVIWRNPWMAVSKETFIGSQLIKMGAEGLLPAFEKKYPEFQIKDFDLHSTYFLFSSEPFPFTKFKNEILALGIRGASLVDGELYSWFGLRSLEFLEKQLGLARSDELPRASRKTF